MTRCSDFKRKICFKGEKKVTSGSCVKKGWAKKVTPLLIKMTSYWL